MAGTVPMKPGRKSCLAWRLTKARLRRRKSLRMTEEKANGAQAPFSFKFTADSSGNSEIQEYAGTYQRHNHAYAQHPWYAALRQGTQRAHGCIIQVAQATLASLA